MKNGPNRICVHWNDWLSLGGTSTTPSGIFGRVSERRGCEPLTNRFLSNLRNRPRTQPHSIISSHDAVDEAPTTLGSLTNRSSIDVLILPSWAFLG